MIEKMHERSNGIVFKIIFALISLSFVLGGIGGGLMMNQDTSAVKINGDEISQHQFSQVKSREQNVRNEEEGKNFWDKLEDPQYAEQFNQGVLNRLISDQLLRQYAKNLNLAISDRQIQVEIVNSPNFQQDGKFNNGLYQQTLRNNGLSPDAYAAIVSDGMLMSQLQEGIIQSDFSVPAQQDLLAKLLMQTRHIRLAVYPLADEIAKQTVSDSELSAFYEQHKQRFTTPEKFTVEYVVLAQKALADQIQVDDAQIQTYYETNKAKYVTAGETKFAHIQLATREEAEQVAQAVKNGEDFAKLAVEKSQDKGSAAQGGELGWAKAGTFPQAFDEAASVLNVGQVSGVVKVDNAFHLIKVLDRKAESVIPLEQLKEQFRDTIRQELIRTEYSSKAREMANKALENSHSLLEVAHVGGVELKTTASFDEKNIPSELNHEAVIRQLFNSDLRKSGQNSEAIELGTEREPYTMFVRISGHEPSSVQEFEQAKQSVSEALKFDKAQQVLQEKASLDLKALESGETNRVKFSELSEVTFAMAQLTTPEQAKAIFAMPKPADNKPSYQLVKDDNGDLLIVALEKVVDGSAERFKPLAEQLSQADQVVLYSQLIQDLRDRAKIEVNEEFMQQQISDR